MVGYLGAAKKIMGTIAIKLNPQELINPGLDVRYTIPDKIEELTNGKIKNDGYDYLEDGFNSMVIFLSSLTPKQEVKDVLNILDKEMFCENKILETAVIAFEENNNYIVVHPQNYMGKFEIE